MNITNTRWVCGRSCEENDIDSTFQLKKKKKHTHLSKRKAKN